MSTTPRPIDPDVFDDHLYFFDWDAYRDGPPERTDPRAWPEDRISELRRLWDEGLYTKDIATKLGVSRGAVIGKAHRLGLAERCSKTDFKPQRRHSKGGTFTKVG